MLPLFPIIAGIIGGGAVAMSNRKMSKGGSTYKDGGEIYTLVNKKTDAHYDTNDKRFYDASWERTLDSEEYLLQLKKNNPEKFEDFEIVRNSFQKGGSTYAGGGEVFNAHILTADNMLIHRRYPKKVTHQEIYQEYKDKGIEVKDSQIHHSKPIDFFDALRKETKRYVNENMNDDVEPSSIFISSTQQGNEYIANSIKGETVSGKPFELTPSDLFKMKKGGSTYAGGGQLKEVTDAIYHGNEKKGRIETRFGSKTYEGLQAMIENDSYEPKEVAEAIFHPNERKGTVATSYGAKTLKGLTAMIENARRSTYAGGGEVYYLRKGDFAVVDEGNGQYGFVNVKEDANAFSKMKKFRDRVSATKIANKFKTKGHTVDVVAYTMTYARGGEVAEINKYKKQLIAKAKKKGLYENFGQAEVRKLEDKYGYTDNVREFDNWVMNFDLSDL